MDSLNEEAGFSDQQDGLEVWKKRAMLYKTVIERYKDYINEQEQKTVPVLKSLVDPSDETVLALRAGIVAKIEDGKKTATQGRVVETKELEYDYERDFPDAAEHAFETVRSLKKTDSELSISFWLTYKEISMLGIADSFDRALLLCSLLVSLGCKNTRVSVLTLEDGSARPVVVFSQEQFFLLDPSNPEERFGENVGATMEDLVSAFASEGGKRATGVSYAFNNEEYEEAGE
jgi:hypothetical protein